MKNQGYKWSRNNYHFIVSIHHRWRFEAYNGLQPAETSIKALFLLKLQMVPSTWLSHFSLFSFLAVNDDLCGSFVNPPMPSRAEANVKTGPQRYAQRPESSTSRAATLPSPTYPPLQDGITATYGDFDEDWLIIGNDQSPTNRRHGRQGNCRRRGS